MKFLKYFLFSIVLLPVADEVQACWHLWHLADEYHIYRVYNAHPVSELDENNPNAERNCKEWQKLTSDKIPLEDIYQAVYKITLDELEEVYGNRDAVHDNEFVEWIAKKDTAILDFMLIAKSNEYIRLRLNSRWYYPSMKIGTKISIEDVVEKSLSAKDKRLRDRYLLQAVRALFSMGKFGECIELWDNEICHLPEENLMRQMIQPYIAGAEFHTNSNERAIEMFAELGDVQSMLYCAGCTEEKLSTIDALEMVCKYAPNSHYVTKTLQSLMDSYYDEEDFGRLNSLCLDMANDSMVKNTAMWYYTAAFLADRKDEVKKASYLLGMAEKSKSTDFLDESIKVFRIYLDAKLQPYNSAYEEKLFKQLEWLDSKICDNLDENIINRTVHSYGLLSGTSYYYWNEMLRGILLVEVCPRMIEAGKTTRALQLANMADNRLYELVGKQSSTFNYRDNNLYTMHAYRYSSNTYSRDYSNYFFEMIDSLGVDAAMRYRNSIIRPKSDFDRFLNSRGYTGSDYINDIIGTQCLRNMRYAEAVEYFSNISSQYRHHHNLYLYYDPFGIEKENIENDYDFKYRFAREMLSLEQGISQVVEPNRKAELMIKYAIGIRNSFGFCWPLTQYYKGTEFWGQVCEKRDWENDNMTAAAREKARKLLKEAFAMFTDDEIAADMNHKFCNFQTVVDKYPYTQKAALVKGCCDVLCDHHLERNYY